MEIVLYFGSFNPIHTAHLKIAATIASLPGVDQLWFVLSPHNPHKDSSTLADENHRLQMVKDGVESLGLSDSVKVCDIELTLPKPSYTYQTLKALREKYPTYNFSIVVGSDNVAMLHKWKNSHEILESTSFYIYPRAGYNCDLSQLNGERVTLLCDVELMNISSTNIRNSMDDSSDILAITKQYIEKYGLYQTK